MQSTREVVPWAALSDAIRANPTRSSAPTTLKKGTSVPALTTLTWLPNWSEDTTCTVPDVVSFVLWVKDPLYRATTPSSRRTMEMEEAASLLLDLDSLWKQHNGRSRGWVRKHIEEDLRLRAGGGDPLVDFWTGVREKKRTALLMDYVCVVRGLRVAVWWASASKVTLYPMLGGSGPVAQLNGEAARMLVRASGFTTTAAETPALLMSGRDISWAPPTSVSATQTMTEMTAELAQFGVSNVGGKQSKTTVWRALQWQRQIASLAGTLTTGAGVYADDEEVVA